MEISRMLSKRPSKPLAMIKAASLRANDCHPTNLIKLLIVKEATLILQMLSSLNVMSFSSVVPNAKQKKRLIFNCITKYFLGKWRQSNRNTHIYPNTLKWNKKVVEFFIFF